MADGRMLKKTISNSKKLSLVSDRAKVIWFMMLPHTDIEGRLIACPEIVKGQYLTMLNYPVKAIQKCLTELHRAGLIVLYMVDGNQYAEFVRFKDFQVLREDKEAKSKIPDPNSGTTPGVVQEDSRYKISKDKISKEKMIICVLDHWNRQKENGRWKTHKQLTPDIQNAIAENLKDWPAEEINQAISNFAMVLQGDDYLWTYDRWGLREFLSRHIRDDRKSLQWWRFHPNNFREDDWLTDKARQSRVKKNRDQEDRYHAMIKFIADNKAWIMEANADDLIKRCRTDPRLKYAVEQLRTDITFPEVRNEQSNSQQ